MGASDNMSLPEKLNYLWNTYNAIVNWIQFSDAKAGAILATNGVVLGLAFSNFGFLQPILAKSVVFQLLFLIGGVALYLSLLLCVVCLMPTLAVGEPSSIVFFAHVAKESKKATDYRDAVNKVFIDSKELDQIADQVWAISTVAWKKYRAVGWAIRAFAVLVLCSLAFIGFSILSQ